MSDPRVLRDVAREVALAAGALLLERFGRPARGLAAKTSATDLVSDADRDAETLIVRLLRERRPRDGVVGEEGASRAGESGLRWLVDPLDGTINYLFHVPHWCVSVACADGSGVLAGVVHQPVSGETFVAARGEGAWLGEARLAVSTNDDLSRALVATGFGYDAAMRAAQAETLRGVLPKVRDIRRFGSAALDLAFVAAGRYDGYFESGVNPWDVAAGELLVREAGGAFAEVDHVGVDRRRGAVASNGRIQRDLLALLA